MKILVASYSRTGTTDALAERAAALLRAAGGEALHARLEPRVQLPYPAWLLLSFFPGTRVPLRGPLPDPRGQDACLLALPKWTFSCPPINEFLARRGADLPPTALLVSCGGWDQERYLAELRSRLERIGVPVLGAMAVKRKAACGEVALRELADFLRRCFERPGPDL